MGDFSRSVSASNAILYYEDIRIYRDHKNMTNRLNNCEQANVDKIINTSGKQLEDINLIKEKIGLDAIDDKLRDVIIYREKYPETSLAELSYIISKETKIILPHKIDLSIPIEKTQINNIIYCINIYIISIYLCTN